MAELFQALRKEQEYLEQMKCRAEEDIKQDGKHKIQGKLRIQKKGNSVQYYHTCGKKESASQNETSFQPQNETSFQPQNETSFQPQNETSFQTKNETSVHEHQNNLNQQSFLVKETQTRQETYIPKKNIELARNLAQRDYDNKLIQEIDKRQTLLNTFLKQYPEDGLEIIYNNQNNYRKNLIKPIVESDEQYAKIWLNTPYIRKIVENDIPEIFTDNGERVRSKSEKMIADRLKRLGIPYRYEAPLRLSRTCVLHPDFTALNIRTRKEYYYEHFGMMDNPEYIEGAMRRLELYEKNGIFPGDNLLFSWETQAAPLNMKIVDAMIKKFLL